MVNYKSVTTVSGNNITVRKGFNTFKTIHYTLKK